MGVDDNGNANDEHLHKDGAPWTIVSSTKHPTREACQNIF